MNRSVLEFPLDGAPAPAAPDENAVESWRSAVGPRLLVAALVAWLGSLLGVELRDMTDVGLLSVMPSSFFIALTLLTVGFLFVLEYRADRRLLVGGYLVLLSAMAHATPALLYGTVRYSWSYQHIGVADFVQRNGGVDSNSEFLQIHHGWPGLFSATAMFSDVTGIEMSTIATWTPFAFSLVSLLSLSIVFRCFVADPRIWSLALWMSVIANWVRQEYFSPQGFTYVLYLALLAIAIPFDRVRRRDRQRFEFRDGDDLRPTDAANVIVSVLGVLAIISIVASHQLTPIMVVLTFGVLAMFRVARTMWVSIAALGATLVWILGPASTYMSSDASEAADIFGSPVERSGASAVDAADVSVGHAIVVIAGRFLAEAMVVLAVLGVVAMWRRRRGSGLVAVLLAAPLVLLVVDLGRETLFRSYLFAVPWMALASAYALTVLIDGRSFAFRLASRSVAVSLLLIAFLFAYLGEERSNQFTEQEDDLAAWVSEVAPPNSLLVEGSPNYPGRARSEENFFYVALPDEPDEAIARMDADPEATMYRWMTDERFAASYFIVTRSMKVDQQSVPTMPVGMLDRIESALVASDRFVVAQSNRDGVVFVVAEGGS